MRQSGSRDPQVEPFLDRRPELKPIALKARELIFDVPTLVSYVSQFMTLLPGDVISTGTPPGVGLGQNPPRYLVDGDEVELGIDGLGSSRQRLRGYR